MAYRHIVGVCNCSLLTYLSSCESLVTNEVDSGIQMYRRSVQLLTFNILVILQKAWVLMRFTVASRCIV